ncbi:tripartite tricarboxylate transporter substrate binding protein [Bradyrhizobium diazoefficiens]|uniref:Bug family tripartite tricarboxylate transporter substrate binding protein n=1 Tax=Bradyrhizobium diazoefficiens TaxID=1355477 RepID=UPI00190D2A7F|nr:tripartite tricarboxylate transporter substrate binding protein [Bradyrhizobium diazoefficiens]MBK3660979.1 tripartite tricarboxylate transporter substrate binding protein [Bradyrhizobium diazoefficiens]
MSVSRRHFLQIAGSAAVSATLPRAARSETPSTRPIHLVIPYAAGGINDAVGRPWAERVRPLLGGVVIQNVGGAGGALGLDMAAHAQADGYTIVMGNVGNLIITPIASAHPLYGAADFEPIYRLVSTALAIVVHPALPVTNLGELVAYAKEHPGQLSYASAGVGTMNHLAGEMFKLQSGIKDLRHVPYRGAAPATNDLIGGHIPIMFMSCTGQLLELHRAGKIRILAMTSQHRLPGAPDVPTAIQSGLPDLKAESWLALLAPKGTPGAAIEHIADATRDVMADPNFREMLMADGMEPELDSNPQKTAQAIEEAVARWTPVIRAIELKLD